MPGGQIHRNISTRQHRKYEISSCKYLDLVGKRLVLEEFGGDIDSAGFYPNEISFGRGRRLYVDTWTNPTLYRYIIRL